MDIDANMYIYSQLLYQVLHYTIAICFTSFYVQLANSPKKVKNAVLFTDPIPVTPF